MCVLVNLESGVGRGLEGFRKGTRLPASAVRESCVPLTSAACAGGRASVLPTCLDTCSAFVAKGKPAAVSPTWAQTLGAQAEPPWLGEAAVPSSLFTSFNIPPDQISYSEKKKIISCPARKSFYFIHTFIIFVPYAPILLP